MIISLKKPCKPDFEVLYQEHYNRVLSYVKKKITSIEDAEDLVSEVFVYCYKQYDEYDPEKSSVTTWLYLIVNSRIKNYYRDHVSYADYDIAEQIVEDDSIDLDRGIYLEQLHEAVMNALQTLPERQRNVILYRCFQDLSYDEIALKLNTTPGNVRVLYSRAIDKLSLLKDSYWKEYNYNG